MVQEQLEQVRVADPAAGCRYSPAERPLGCFRIAPNRAIYHAWLNSGGWQVMPRNGLADDTAGYYTFIGGRGVIVRVSTIGYYCSDYTTVWQPWYRCFQ